jgi:hypothetical protein
MKNFNMPSTTLLVIWLSMASQGLILVTNGENHGEILLTHLSLHRIRQRPIPWIQTCYYNEGYKQEQYITITTVRLPYY